MSKKVYSFASPLSPDEIVVALRRNADEKKKTLFPLGNGDAHNTIFEIRQEGFRLIHRAWNGGRYPRRWFYVSVSATPNGSMITGHYDLARRDRCLTRVWQSALIVFGLPFFLIGFLAAIHPGHVITHQEWSRILVPLTLAFYLGPGMAIARVLDEGNEAAVLQFIQTSLRATAIE